jgi:spermidine synthase
VSALDDLVQAFKVKHETVFSKGAKLQVVENKKVKMFKLDDVTHSIINKKSIYTKGYWDYFLPLAYAYKKPRILMIGLGIGTTVYQLRALFGKKISLDVVEKDPEVVALAQKHVNYLRNERIIVTDGVNYVSKTQKKYDLIILDAYEKAARIPEQFLTENFARKTFGALKREGVLAINYAMNPSGLVRFSAFKRILRNKFKVYSVNTDSYGGIQIILCSKGLYKETLLGRVAHSMKKNKANGLVLKRYSEMKELI